MQTTGISENVRPPRSRCDWLFSMTEPPPPDDDLIALDAAVRHSVRLCLRILPAERRTSAHARRELHRLIRRALSDLDEDRRAFAAPDPAAVPSLPPAPGNRHGAPWTATEEAQLRAAFAQDPSLESLARLHGRRISGIRSRLVKLGLLPPRT